MHDEFKKSKSNNETRYTLESMTAGATGSGSIATSAGSVGKVQKRGNILAQEAGKDKVDASKPRNFVAKNAKMGGAGAHKDKKKEQKQGVEKHKKPYMEALKQKIEDLKSKLNEADGVAEGERTMSRAAKGNEKYGKDGMKALAKAGREGASEKKLDAIRDKHDNYNEDSDPCWKDYKQIGMKKKGGKQVPNCVPKESIEEGSVKELMYDLKHMSDEEFVAQYKMSKAEARKQATSVAEVAPKGWEGTVKAMKKHKDIDNPYALANYMKNKGYKSHKKEGADPYFESLASKLDDLKKKN